MISYLIFLIDGYAYNKTFALMNQCNEDLYPWYGIFGNIMLTYVIDRPYNYRILNTDHVIFDLLPRRYRYSSSYL